MAEICRVCKSPDVAAIFNANILGSDVSYFECGNCSYVQTEFPHWLKKAYLNPINASDTGIIVRNKKNVGLVLSALYLLNARKSAVVDYAGGYGLLVRMLRDVGIEALWSDQYATNLFARQFEYLGQSASLVTAFEAFEHFVEPISEVKRILDIAPNILITTSLIPSPTPAPNQWWYYGLEHGQHIGFFRLKTFEWIASTLGLHLISDQDSIHFLSKRPCSARKWKILRSISNINYNILSHGLKSKTWEDHLCVSRVNAILK